MANVEGVFYVLICGLFISAIFALIDVLLETRKRCKISKVCDDVALYLHSHTIASNSHFFGLHRMLH